MAGDDGNGVKDKVEELTGNGSTSKEALTAAAVSAVGALAASKGPDLIRKVVGATEEKGEEEAQQMGEKAMKGAKESLGSAGPAGKIASKLMGGGGGGSGGGKKKRGPPNQRRGAGGLPIHQGVEEVAQ